MDYSSTLRTLKGIMLTFLVAWPGQNVSHAQTPFADSLRRAIHIAADSEKKLEAILQYCDQFQSLNRDTVYNYALLAVRMANETGDELKIARAKLAFANSYFVWGWTDSSMAVIEEALPLVNAQEAAARSTYFKLLRQKAMCYGGTSRFAEGLDILYGLLDLAKKYKDTLTIATTCNTIGSFQIATGDAGKAIAMIKTAESFLSGDSRYDLVKANIFTNLANANMRLQQTDSALYYIQQAIPLCRKVQNLHSLATALRVESSIYTTVGNFRLAEADLLEMQQIRRLLNGESNILEDNIQLANFYASTGQLERAIQLCIDNIKSGNATAATDTSVSTYTNTLRMKLRYYEALAEYYKQAGLADDYLATLEAIIAAKDSFYEANSAMAMAEMQTKYEVQQKENTILQQQYDLTRKNLLFYGSLLLLLLAGIIFFLLFRNYRQKQKLKMQQAVEMEKTAAAAAVKDAEDKERKRIAADLHDNLGVQANAILYNTELLKQGNAENANLAEDLHDTAREMLLNLRETLWAMKSNDIATTDLWLRVINFCRQMGRHYAHIQFKVRGTPPEAASIPSVKALHLMMVIQEAVQNAVKHAQANLVEVVSSFQDYQWEIQVTDNGTGFEKSMLAGKTESYGLNNMQERAKASGLVLTVESVPGKGTTVCIGFAILQPVNSGTPP